MGESKKNPKSILKKQGLLQPKEKPRKRKVHEYDMLDFILINQFKRKGK